jgi:phosphoglycerol transferase MdoB-like AlkP superfamily enzyme
VIINVVQMCFFLLTLYKFLVALHNGWRRTPIITLLARDGTWSFFVNIGAVASTWGHILYNHLLICITQPYGRVMSLWYWLSSGRLHKVLYYPGMLLLHVFNSGSVQHYSWLLTIASFVVGYLRLIIPDFSDQISAELSQPDQHLPAFFTQAWYKGDRHPLDAPVLHHECFLYSWSNGASDGRWGLCWDVWA